MAKLFNEHIEFYRQFRKHFLTTGAIAPSGRFLAKTVIGPMANRDKPARILEVGPGTGAFTKQIVKHMNPGDQLDLVELNEAFAELLEQQFQTRPEFQQHAESSRVHVCPLQEFNPEYQYDFIISGLPMNNFSPDLVKEIYESFIRLLKPGGVLSYFEYMYVRPFRRVVSTSSERSRIREIDNVIDGYLNQYRFQRNWVFANVPPAWVQHLQFENGEPREAELATTSA